MLTLIGGLIVIYFVYVLIARKNDKSSTDPPVMAHTALKEIVERTVDEARKLPGLGTSTDVEHHRERRDIADRSYEELLATAILNKVIEKFQKERVDDNSNILRDIDPSKAKQISIVDNRDLEEDVLSYTSCHLKCNDYGASIKRNGDYRDPVSFMMEERIEEVTTITSDDEFGENNVLEFEYVRRVPFPEFGIDIVDPPRELSSLPLSLLSDSTDFDRNRHNSMYCTTNRNTMDLVSPIESWEDNWLFQKKKHNRSQPDAVAMLVPSSNTYYKALIGDRDAEDTSDLSECSSTRSDDEVERELMEAINNVVPRTPMISECDADNNEEVLNDAVQFGQDQVDESCQEKTKIEKNTTVDEYFNVKYNKELLRTKERTIEDKNNKEKQNSISISIITEAEEERIKEKFKDVVKYGDKTAAITAKNSDNQKSVKTLEKLNEKNDRRIIIDESEEQREGEYTEHYDTATQRHLDSLTKVDVCYEENEIVSEAKNSTTEELLKNSENDPTNKHKDEHSEAKVQLPYVTIENHVEMMNENDRLSSPPRPGTIAEREHKKWENAPPIQNNPYSEENIQKRVWERRYSCKSADTNLAGIHYEVTKLNEVNLETLLTPNPPDIKRFGRDYYINQSKVTGGERVERANPAISLSSRPSSSLSQRSSCVSDEQHEQQEENISKEIDGITILKEDTEIRTTILNQRSNVEVISPETNNHIINSQIFLDIDRQRTRSKKDVIDDEIWIEQRVDDMEDWRKNSKNKINAKLNNQEHKLQVEQQDKEREIRRIDLKAYGFENEFLDQRIVRQTQQVVSKLDLKTFGYQEDLRHIRSNQLDNQSEPHNEKSNLTRCVIDRKKHLAKSSSNLDNLHEQIKNVGGSFISAKSMPNIAGDIYYYANSVCIDNDDNEGNNDDQDRLTTKNLLECANDKPEKTGSNVTIERDMMNTGDDGSLNSNDEISPDMDFDSSLEDTYIGRKDHFRSDEQLPMPSVKRLVAVFGRQQTTVIEPTFIKVPSKADNVKNRSCTPEIQIIGTPKQMHSLTARSLSKEFREGLRQVPGKVSPSVSRSLIEEQSTNRIEMMRSKREDSDIDVISPGKFKSNILFWEQMQKKS